MPKPPVIAHASTLLIIYYLVILIVCYILYATSFDFTVQCLLFCWFCYLFIKSMIYYTSIISTYLNVHWILLKTTTSILIDIPSHYYILHYSIHQREDMCTKYNISASTYYYLDQLMSKGLFLSMQSNSFVHNILLTIYTSALILIKNQLRSLCRHPPISKQSYWIKYYTIIH